MIEATISHYHILEKLGEGGMGVVYKAHDTKLDRIVALKFLPQQVTVSAEDKARFLQEAKAISALNHPNIATIHDIDEVDSQQFLVLEYIPGGTLKSKLKYLKSEDREFSIGEVLDYAIQAAEALAHAHRHQIIHRDVKTDNLMLTEEGKVKLTDFGLAKLRGSVQVTKTGTTVGTAAYMSPEQIRGEEVDQRSDIFSLGVVLYELVTTHLPFHGEFETALSYSILNENPQPARTLRKNLPPALEKIIDRCLEKEKTKRYQRAEEVVDALKEVRLQISPARRIQKKGLKIPLLVGSALVVVVAVVFITYFFWPEKPITPVEKSIAVLPFVDISPQKDQEYFCDGITEELIDRLSKLRELKVPARTSAFAFKGKSQDIREIGRQLDVQTVLEGSVRKDSSKLRITAQLINVADGYHIWSNTYDRELRDIFAIQDEISLAIVGALKVKLTAEEDHRLSEKPIDNVAAYECYLRATDDTAPFTEDRLDRAVQYLKKGINIIGDNALLYAGLATAYWRYVDLGLKQEDYISKAEECVKKALSLDPNLPKAHVILGTIYRDFRGKPKEAALHYKKALDEDPNESEALIALGFCYNAVGKTSAARLLMERLKRVDPLNVSLLTREGLILLFEGQFEPALDLFRKSFQSHPEEASVQFFYCLTLMLNNRPQEASSLVDGMVKASPNSLAFKSLLLLEYALLKNEKKAYELMTSDYYRWCKRDAYWSYRAAVVFALLDKRKEALDWLENAVDRGFINYPLLAQKDPFLENLRGEERFKKLMERVKKEWEEFEV
jgi:serine/threonine protein kinase/Flp pilus assembly protein TadD